jgi:peptidoglycan/LPS O-acetylase OafA/YrhL
MSSGDDQKRITSIDGFRGLAILAVMLHHVPFAPGFPDWLRPFTDLIPRAVTAFWVLSGFLITRSILSDEERSGSTQFQHYNSDSGSESISLAS